MVGSKTLDNTAVVFKCLLSVVVSTSDLFCVVAGVRFRHGPIRAVCSCLLLVDKRQQLQAADSC